MYQMINWIGYIRHLISNDKSWEIEWDGKTHKNAGIFSDLFKNLLLQSVVVSKGHGKEGGQMIVGLADLPRLDWELSKKGTKSGVMSWPFSWACLGSWNHINFEFTWWIQLNVHCNHWTVNCYAQHADTKININSIRI